MNPLRRVVSFALATTLGLAAMRAQCDLAAIPGDPLRQLRGHVDSLALFDPDGAGPLPLHLVAGGTFDVGSAVNEHVVMWNGTSWGNTNATFGAPVAMIVWNNLLVAACEELLWTWNGTSWSLLAGGEEGSPSAPLPGVINALAVWNGELVVGGRFTRITAPFVSVNALHVAKLSPTTGWSAFGPGPTTTGMTGVNVRALGVFNNTVWAGLGCSTNFSNTATLQSWNGSTWAAGGWTDPIDAIGTRIGTTITNSWMFVASHSLISPVFSVAGFNPALGTSLPTFVAPPAAGISRVEQFFVRSTGINSYEVACAITTNGNDKVWRWTAAGGWVALPNLTDVAGPITATRINFFSGRYVAGLRCATGAPQGLRQHDSVTASWPTFVGPGIDATVYCVCEDGAETVIGGRFTAISGQTMNGIARGHAGAWQPLGPGFTGGIAGVMAVAKMPNGDLVAGGDFTALGDGTPMNHIARWNGVAWTGIGGGVDNAVDALLVLPNGELIVAGWFTSAGGVPASRVARWTGSAWVPLGVGCNSGVRSLLLASNGDVVAGGAFVLAGGVTANGIARWNGTSWSAMGGGFDGDVYALTESDDGIVAGGSFLHADGFLAPHVARWNGAAWAPFGPVPMQPSARIFAVATLPGGETVIGGETFNAGLVTMTAAAIWRGTSWETLDVLGGAVEGMVMRSDGRLAIGGSFDSVENVVSARVAGIGSSCAATATTFAPGCPSSGGSNTLAALALPWANGTLRTQGTGLPANAVVLTVTSVTPIAPGVPLTALFAEGVAGCSLGVAPDILGALVASGGVASSVLGLPNTPPIVGVTFYQQMLPLELDPVSGALLAVTATNTLQFTAGLF